MDLQLTGKVALVTGGNSGLGLATAICFAQEGAKVVIAARDEKKCQDAVSKIRAQGGEASYVITDMANHDGIRAMVDFTVTTYGGLDCAVNNAGYDSKHQPLIDFDEEEWDRAQTVNLKGTWLCLKYQIPQMLRSGGGAIVNVSSSAGLWGIPNLTPYVASKHGMLGLSKTASSEYSSKNIRVNTICPGGIQTPMLENTKQEDVQRYLSMVPMGRLGTPEEFAAAAVFLCSPRASYITGITLSVDGGSTQH
jgi:NAD(P)-dependent dehydrogenase (short-subunit alcohol dehydrogenase family)